MSSSSESLVTALSVTPQQSLTDNVNNTSTPRKPRKSQKTTTPSSKTNTTTSTNNTGGIVGYTGSESSPDAAGGDRYNTRRRRTTRPTRRNKNPINTPKSFAGLFPNEFNKRSSNYPVEDVELLLYTAKEVLALVESERFGCGPTFLCQLNSLINRMAALSHNLARNHCNRSLSPILKPNFLDNLIFGRSPPKELLSTDMSNNPLDDFSCNIPPAGERVIKRDKIMVPEHPNYNFIGRILGPRGISVRQLEAATGCGILIRGKGSVKNADREERLRQRNMPGFEHLKEPLHVLITAEGTTEEEADKKIEGCRRRIEKLLKPEYDEYKRRQLAQLAMINGNYDASRAA